MTDLFDEVEEQLRSERLSATVRKAGPWVLGVGLALVVAALAVWGWREYQARETAKASETYAQALEAMTQGKADEAYRLFGQVAKSAPRVYRSLALTQQGAARLAQDKPKEAVAFFDQAAEAATDPIIGDAARLKAAFVLMDTAPYKDIEARLSPLIAAERPYQLQAREALAFAKLAAGDLTGARGDFVVISLLPDASPAVQGRAEAAINLIDSGSAKAMPAAIKAAATAPAFPALAPGLSGAPQPTTPGPQ